MHQAQFLAIEKTFQQQYSLIESRFAQRDRFFDIQHRKARGFFHRVGGAQQAVAVGVGL